MDTHTPTWGICALVGESSESTSDSKTSKVCSTATLKYEQIKFLWAAKNNQNFTNLVISCNLTIFIRFFKFIDDSSFSCVDPHYKLWCQVLNDDVEELNLYNTLITV